MSYDKNRKCTAPSDVVFVNDRKNFLFLSDYQLYRILEIIPMAFIWTVLVTALLVSFFAPLFAIYFIIVFDMYWFIRIIYLSVYMINSWIQYKKTVEKNWFEELIREYPERWKEIKHVVFLPMVHEPYEIVAATIRALLEANYPSRSMYVVLAGEERKKEHFNEIAVRAKKEFGHFFADFIITIHPADLPDEVVGKGSNVHYAGKQFKTYLDERSISYENVIVSSFDVDTVAHKEYFSRLTYVFLSQKEPHKKSYQPLAVYSNNTWEAPIMSRLVAYSTTFWLLTDLARPERLFTFSSQSMSFKMLVDVGFWQKDIVTEDSRIFLQGFLKYSGDYLVVPLYVPVYMDCVHSGNLLSTLKNVYKQVRRWAWGIENFPYLGWKFLKERNFPFWKGFKYLWNQIEGVFTWATAPIIMLIMGFLPLIIIQYHDDVGSVIVQYAPIILKYIMRVTSIGILIIAYITIKLHTMDKKELTFWQKIISIIQWLIIPVSLVCFGSVPAIEACTRMGIKKYLGFRATEKIRVK